MKKTIEEMVPLTPDVPPDCPLCKDRHYIFDKKTRQSKPCVCTIRTRVNALADLPDTKGYDPFCPPQALAFSPMENSIIFTGPVDMSAALIKGILISESKANMRIDIRDSKNLAAAFAGDGETDEMNKLIALDLLIIPISYGTPSERVGQVTFFTWDERQKRNKPTWFIVYAVDTVLRNSYIGPLMDLLSGKDVFGMRLKEINAVEMRRLSLATTGGVAVSPSTVEVERHDSEPTRPMQASTSKVAGEVTAGRTLMKPNVPIDTGEEPDRSRYRPNHKPRKR